MSALDEETNAALLRALSRGLAELEQFITDNTNHLRTLNDDAAQARLRIERWQTECNVLRKWRNENLRGQA